MVYPNAAYKGYRFNPTDVKLVFTQLEAELLMACEEALTQFIPFFDDAYKILYKAKTAVGRPKNKLEVQLEQIIAKAKRIY